MLAMMRSISEDDQQLVQGAENSKEIWLALKAKYEERLVAHARQYLKNYVNFEVQDGQGIDDAWAQLQTIGRRIEAIVPDLATLNKPQHRIHVLLGALPLQYTALIDTIDGQPHLSPEQILARLHEKEMSLGLPSSASTDTAMAATHTYSRAKKTVTCFLCDEAHGIQSCPYYEIARKTVATAKQRKTEAPEPSKEAHPKPTKETASQTPDGTPLSLLRRIEKLEHAQDDTALGAVLYPNHSLDCGVCGTAREGQYAAFGHVVMPSDSEDE
jgi:hypothetical protein